MGHLANKERKLNADHLAGQFRRTYRGDNITGMFTNRTHEEEFESIGKAYVGSRRAANLDPHLLVWTGYEVVTNSKYL